MMNFRNISGTLLVSILLLSNCGEADSNEETKKETPKALQDNNNEFEKYSRSGDLTEELFQELVNNNPVLKKLEEDINATMVKHNQLKVKFNMYDTKSNSYYNSSNSKANAISDSLLKSKIVSLISESNKRYTSKTTEINSLLKQIAKDNVTLNDYHSVLKIALTIPIIEKYQGDNKPNNKEFKDLLNEQEKLIMKTDSLIQNAK